MPPKENKDEVLTSVYGRLAAEVESKKISTDAIKRTKGQGL